MESMLSDENAAAFLEKLAKRDKGIKEKVVSWLKELAAKLKNAMTAYKDVKPYSPEGKMVAEMEDFRKEIMGIYTSALVDAGENFRENGGNENTTREGGDVAYQARPSEKDPRFHDPRTVTKADVLEMLNNVKAGKYYGNTYIPLRIGTPSVLIYWAEKRRGDIIDNNPIAMSAEKAHQAMARKGQDVYGRPHEQSPDDIIAIVEAMGDPEYIVYQGANGRYVEVVSYDTTEGKKSLAVLEIGDYKPEWTMNGYKNDMYNILVTTYPPDNGVVADLLRNKTNHVIYDKKKDAPRGTPGSNVPSVSNDASFFEDMVPQEGSKVNKKSGRIDTEEVKSSEEVGFAVDDKTDSSVFPSTSKLIASTDLFLTKSPAFCMMGLGSVAGSSVTAASKVCGTLPFSIAKE